MEIAVITFDGDQTLWDFRKAMRRSLECVLTCLRARVGSKRAEGLTVADLVHARDKVADELAATGATHEEIRRRSFARVLRGLGIAGNHPLLDELYHLYMDKRYSLIEVYPDTMHVLGVLSTRYRIGLISNGNTYPEKCGLSSLFGFTVFATDIGFRKPSAEIFLAAAERGGCSPPAMLHVGDRLDTDVIGARNAGAKAAWLNREGLPLSGKVEPDVELRSLTELLQTPLLGY